MRPAGWAVVVAMGVALGGCGFSPSGAAPDGAHGADAPRGSDAGRSSADAGRGSASTGADLVLGAGRTTVGTITADIQLGAGPQLTHATAGTVTLEGHPVITP